MKAAKIALIAAISMISAASAYADPTNSATAQGTAKAYVVQPIAISTVNGGILDFGRFAANDGGTIKVDTKGAESLTGSVNPVAGNHTSQAQFKVTGENGGLFSVNLPQHATISNGKGGSMDVSMFTDATDDGSGNYNLVLDDQGGEILNVGATLTVGAHQAPGAYSGTFPVTVSYQ